MSLFHLDTNALIALSDPTLILFERIEACAASGNLPETSVIAWHEYMRGPLLPKDRKRALAFLGERIAPLTRPVAEAAALLFNATGRRRASTADCLIAATAIEANAELLTQNIADFECFISSGLRLARV